MKTNKKVGSRLIGSIIFTWVGADSGSCAVVSTVRGLVIVQYDGTSIDTYTILC